MSPVYIVVALVVAFRIAGGLGLVGIHSIVEAVRWGTGISFIIMGAAHFTPMRHDVARLVPPWFRRPPLVVMLLGAWQVAGGAGLITPSVRHFAAGALVLLLLLKLPANVLVARKSMSLRGRFATPPGWRVPAQFLWIALVWWAGT